MGKIPKLPEIKIKKLTALAIGSGLGAALGYQLIPWYTGILVLLFALFLPHRSRLRYLLAAAVCLISGVGHKYFDDLEKSFIPRHASSFEGYVMTADRRLTACNKLPVPKVVNAVVSQSGKKFKAAVIFPENTGRILSGESFNVRGILMPATPGGVRFDGNKSAKILPPIYGDRPLLIVKELKKAPEQFYIFRIFFKLRELMLAHMLKHIDDPEVCSMAARMFFSASTGASRELNRKFAISGTIHLFSVSGIHVSILAGIILWLLRFAPFKWRYRITAVLIPVYVMCTGASIPAIRAGAMIVIWCLMRSMLFYAPGWNAMMLCWSAFAFLAPETTGNLGAQYSFGITAALILLIDKLQTIKQNDRALLDLMPPRHKLTEKKRKKFRYIHKIRLIIAIPVTAYIASCGLSLLRQQLLVPGSILANLLLPCLTPLLFPGLVFKLTAGALHPVLDRAGAWILEKSFQVLAYMISAIADIFAPIAAVEPPVWGVILFYILLFILLSSRNFKINFVCTAGILLLLGATPFLKSASPGKILIVNRGINTPALLAYIPPGNATAWIVNVPDNATANIAGRELKKSGVLYCNVAFSAGTGAASYGLENLTRQLPCTACIPDNKRKNTKAFERNIQLSNAYPDNINRLFDLTTAQKDSVIWRTFDGLQISASNQYDGRQITVTLRNGKSISGIMPWCSIPLVWQFEIP